jgi:hypothetical protein
LQRIRVTSGFLKNEPALRLSGSSGASTIALRARIVQTASRTSASVGVSERPAK